MGSGINMSWKTSNTLIVIAVLTACSGANSPNKRVDAADSRPAYHLVSVTEEGVKIYDSPDGIQWNSSLHKSLSATDCYDIALSPNGLHRFLVYSHTDKNGIRALNVLQSTGTKRWASKASKLVIPETVSCGQPQMRHLRENLYAILWLDEGSLYSAIYDANEKDGHNLILSGPVEDNWLSLVEMSELSFAYHDGSIYVVWSPNSKDRIMTMRGDINGQTINYGEPDYHLENHTSVSNMISDGELMNIAVVTGKRVNILMTSDDGAYWDEGPSCYNLDNIPLFIPFLYKDAKGEKLYLKSEDYAGTVNYLQNFSDCETTEVKIPSEAIHIEYFSGL